MSLINCGPTRRLLHVSPSTLIRVADGLTGTRLLVAPVLVLTAGSAHLSATAILVSVAWLTDMWDGRLARRSGIGGRLGAWDLRADTVVGLCLVAGLTIAGLANVWLLVVAGVLIWPFIAGNVTAAMLIQLAGFVPLLLLLWSRRPSAWWAPFVIALAAGILDWRRLLFVNIPAFLGLPRSKEHAPR